MEKKINLQLFAESEETPTNEVENSEPTNEVEEEETEEVEEEVEFDDNNTLKEDEEVKKNDTEKKQKTQNFNNAQLRIQRKKQEELEKLKREAYVKGVIASTNGKNPITSMPIKDEVDVEQLELLNEMRLNNVDVDDVGKVLEYMANKKRQENEKIKQQQEQEQKEHERIDNELLEFSNKYGNETTEKVLNDEKFEKFASKLISKGFSISEAYEMFIETKTEVEAQAQKLVKQKEARKKATVGQFGNSQTQEVSFENLSFEERKKIRDSVRNKF